MTSHALESVALALVAEGKGILAADETLPTLTKRFDALGIRSTEERGRTYREMLFTRPGAAEFISGVIMYDETIRQNSANGTPVAEALTARGILPGIKVDTAAKPLAGSPNEAVTEGLDGLRDRLREYHGMGARLATWRAVIHVQEALPSGACVNANAHGLARYATLCQERGLVPIVESEVLVDRPHTIERCEQVTGGVLRAVFHALFEQGVALAGMLLKADTIIAGKGHTHQASVQEVAAATWRCLRRHVPAAVCGIVFLSGGQHARLATAHLSAINQLQTPKPLGRKNFAAGQQAFCHRARLNGRRVSGRTQLRWRRRGQMKIRRTAAASPMTDRRGYSAAS